MPKMYIYISKQITYAHLFKVKVTKRTYLYYETDSNWKKKVINKVIKIVKFIKTSVSFLCMLIKHIS